MELCRYSCDKSLQVLCCLRLTPRTHIEEQFFKPSSTSDESCNRAIIPLRLRKELESPHSAFLIFLTFEPPKDKIIPLCTFVAWMAAVQLLKLCAIWISVPRQSPFFARISPPAFTVAFGAVFGEVTVIEKLLACPDAKTLCSISDPCSSRRSVSLLSLVSVSFFCLLLSPLFFCCDKQGSRMNHWLFIDGNFEIIPEGGKSIHVFLG